MKNDDAQLMPITRYNTHYYFEETGFENNARVRPTAFTAFNNVSKPEYYQFLDVNGVLDPNTRPAQIIREDHNIYSFSVPLTYYTDYYTDYDDSCDLTSGNGCDVPPAKWIDSDFPNLDVEKGQLWDSVSGSYFDALDHYRNLAAFEIDPSLSYKDINIGLVGNEDPICAEPMLEAMENSPSLTYIPQLPCSDVVTGGSQQPLRNDGFDYIESFPSTYEDDYQLFRRDFYGESRRGNIFITVGAFQ